MLKLALLFGFSITTIIKLICSTIVFIKYYDAVTDFSFEVNLIAFLLTLIIIILTVCYVLCFTLCFRYILNISKYLESSFIIHVIISVLFFAYGISLIVLYQFITKMFGSYGFVIINDMISIVCFIGLYSLCCKELREYNIISENIPINQNNIINEDYSINTFTLNISDDATIPIDESCSICLENFNDTISIIKLECNHTYHKDCITAWLNNNETCPLCRQNVI